MPFHVRHSAAIVAEGGLAMGQSRHVGLFRARRLWWPQSRSEEQLFYTKAECQGREPKLEGKGPAWRDTAELWKKPSQCSAVLARGVRAGRQEEEPAWW